MLARKIDFAGEFTIQPRFEVGFSRDANANYQQARRFHKEAIDHRDETRALLAKRYYEQAIAIAPSAEIFTNYALLLLDLGEEKASFDALKKAQEIDEYNPLVRINLALSYLEQGNFERAETHLSVAAEIDPQNPLIAQTWTYVCIAKAQQDLKLLDITSARRSLVSAEEMKKVAEKMSGKDNPELKILQTTYAKVEQVLLAMEEGFLPNAENVIEKPVYVPMVGFYPQITPVPVNDK